MVVVQNRVFNAAGDPIVGAYVPISLSIPGYLSDGTIVAPITVVTDANGLWQADLVPNSDISPAGTYYRVSESGVLSLISVPSAGTPPFEMTGLLVSDPENPGAIVSGVTTVEGRAGSVTLSDLYAPLGPFNTLSDDFDDLVTESGYVRNAALSTGVISGGALSISPSGPTAFDIAAVSAFIVGASITRLDEPAKTVLLDAAAQLRIQTYILMDINGDIIQQATAPTAEERRLNVVLGIVAFNPGLGLVISATALPVSLTQPANQVADLMDALGPFTSNTGNKLSTNGANLTLAKTSGKVFTRSASHTAFPNDPHEVDTPAQAPIQIRRIISVSLPSFPPLVTTIDPTNYDLNGVITPVGGGVGSSTIQRVWLTPTSVVANQVTVQYGQTVYSSMATALDNIGAGTYVVNPVINGIAVLMAWIVVTRVATNLTDSTQARIINASKFANP